MSEDLWLDLEPGKPTRGVAPAVASGRRWTWFVAGVVLAAAIIAGAIWSARGPDPVPARQDPAAIDQPADTVDASDVPDTSLIDLPDPSSAASSTPGPAASAPAADTATIEPVPRAKSPADATAATVPHRVGSAQRPNKEMVWSQTYRPGPACLNPEDWDAYVDCVNKSIRARQEFEERWSRGEIPQP